MPNVLSHGPHAYSALCQGLHHDFVRSPLHSVEPTIPSERVDTIAQQHTARHGTAGVRATTTQPLTIPHQNLRSMSHGARIWLIFQSYLALSSPLFGTI